MTLRAGDPGPLATHLAWLRDWWHVLTAMAASALIAWRRLIVTPARRLDAVVDAQGATQADVERLRTDLRQVATDVRSDLDEVRVAQARISTTHASELQALRDHIDGRLDALHSLIYAVSRNNDKE